MDRIEALEGLKALAHLDVDAVYAYNHALQHIKVPLVHSRLLEFRHDHERHVVALSAMIRKHGGEAPPFARDLRGFVMEGIAAVRSFSGTAGALRAMRNNEEITNRAYVEALGLNMPADCRNLLEDLFGDEVAHRAYLQQAIDDSVWELGHSESDESTDDQHVSL